MRQLFTVILAVSVVVPALGQRTWSLRECIDHALAHNIEIRQTELRVNSAENELNTARNSRLPNFDVGAGQSFGFGRSQVRYQDPTTNETYNRYENTQTASTSFSASAGLPVFQGFRIANQIRVGRFNLAAAEAGLDRAKENLELNVTALYLDVLLKHEILTVRRDQTELMRKQTANTSAMIEAGNASRSQLLDIESQLAQNEASVVSAEGDFSMSLLTLAQSLNLPDADGFDVAKVGDAVVGQPQPVEEIYQLAVTTKPVIREAELNLQSADYQIRVARASRWPSLTLGANAGTGYQYLFGQSTTQRSFWDQLRNQQNASVGLNLSVPIFNRFSTRNSIRGAQISARNQQLTLENARITLRKEIQRAWQNAISAGARYRAASKALEAAQEAFRATELRYVNGKATAYEYSEAASKLMSSRSEQAQAKYDNIFSSKILDFYAGRPLEINP